MYKRQVQTSGGSTFYIVIDYDKPTDEDAEQYETYFFSVVDEAWKIPGVVDILTCFDVPDWEYATCGHPLSLDPAHTDVANKRILTKRVRYYGDEIAAVVAESDLAAQKALEAIRVRCV